MSLVDHIAAQIAGPGAVAVFREDITKGKAHEGLRIFSVQPTGGFKNSKRFVEKVSPQEVEGQLATLLAECDDADLEKYRIPAPRIFHVENQDDRYKIYIDFVEGTYLYSARALPKEIAESGLENKIAEVAYKFSTGVSRLYADTGQRAQPSSLFGKDVIHRVEKNIGSAALPWFLDTVKRLEKALSDSPRTICHNDISWPNMSIQENADSPSNIVLIDFGLMGENYIGADLHHFAVASYKTPARSQFFDRIALRLSELHGAPLSHIRAAAFFYAAHRYIRRKIKTPGSERYFIEVMDILFRAQQELKISN